MAMDQPTQVDESAGLCSAVFDVGAEDQVCQEAGNETSDGAK